MTLTKETIALIIIGTVSTAALILGIIGVAQNGHGCNRGDIMPMMGNARMMQGQMDGEERIFMKNRMGKMMQGTGALQPAVQDIPAQQ